MVREKYNQIQELQKRAKELQGKNRLAMVGQGDFPGRNNTTRGGMNVKHKLQHVAIDNPEFPFVYDGKENLTGEYSSFHFKTKQKYRVIDIVKKYEGLMKGKCYFSLIFLYCKEDHSYRVIERKEVENLPENFGFDYNNEYLDDLKPGDIIEPGTEIQRSRSYDDFGNVGIGVNGRIMYGVHPGVQDDAIIVSKSFAQRMVTNNVTAKTIPIDDNTIILNLYGKDGEYAGLPNIGDTVRNGIIAATRTVKETRMFSDLRDASLRNINLQSDAVFYGEGEVIDINVYCNKPNITHNKVNAQILQYYIDAKWFYTQVYRVCKRIIADEGATIDREIRRWMRRAMNYLDTDAIWAFNDNTFPNIMVEILLRQKQPINIGRKIVGRAGTTISGQHKLG